MSWKIKGNDPHVFGFVQTFVKTIQIFDIEYWKLLDLQYMVPLTSKEAVK